MTDSSFAPSIIVFTSSSLHWNTNDDTNDNNNGNTNNNNHQNHHHQHHHRRRHGHQPGAHNAECVTLILGLCHGVFTGWFIFRRILQHFLPRKWKLRSVHERIRNIRSDKGKPNVNKRSKMPFLGV